MKITIITESLADLVNHPGKNSHVKFVVLRTYLQSKKSIHLYIFVSVNVDVRVIRENNEECYVEAVREDLNNSRINYMNIFIGISAA